MRYLYTLMYPTPPLTYCYPHPSQYLPLPLLLPCSPYLLPWAPPAFLEGWGQDRVRGCHLTAKYYYGGVVHFRPIRGGGGGGGVVGTGRSKGSRSRASPGGAMPPPLLLSLPTSKYPYSSPYLLPLLLPLPTIPLVHGVR